VDEEGGGGGGWRKNKVVERTVFEGNAMKIFKHDREKKKREIFSRWWFLNRRVAVARKLRADTRRRRDKGRMHFSRRGQGPRKGMRLEIWRTWRESVPRKMPVLARFHDAHLVFL